MYNNNISRTTLALARSRMVNQATRRAVLGGRYSNTSGRLSSSRFGNNNTSNLLNASNTSKEKIAYTGIKDAASQLQKHADRLLQGGAGSLFDKAMPPVEGTEAGDEEATQVDKKEQAEYAKKIYEEIEAFVKQYNAMIDKMKSAGGTMNSLYVSQLKGYCEGYEEELKAVGITCGKDGNLKINDKTLKASDLSNVKKLFGVDGGFADKVSEMGNKIEVNAASNLAYYERSSYSNTYGKYGTYNSYDYRGSSLNRFG